MSRTTLHISFVIIAVSIACSGCGKQYTDTEKETTAISAAAPASAKIAGDYDEELCSSEEEILISFDMEDSEKRLSVCLSKEKPGYIVYRFGTGEQIEFEYPENKEESWDKFVYSYYLRGGGPGNEGLDLNYLIFENGGYEYKIYEEYNAGNDTREVGVIVKNKADNTETKLKGVTDSLEGSLIGLRGTEIDTA